MATRSALTLASGLAPCVALWVTLGLATTGCPGPEAAPEQVATAPSQAAPPTGKQFDPAALSGKLPFVTAEGLLDGERIHLRVLTPVEGHADAEAAARTAVTELLRVGTLGADSPELMAVGTAAQRMLGNLGGTLPERVLLDAVRLGYGVDRAAAKLEHAGFTDFLIDAERCVRTGGSQDGGVDKGWRVAVQTPETDAPPPGTVVLQGEVLATVRGEAGLGSAVGQGSARAVAAATAVAMGLLDPAASPTGPTGPSSERGLALRRQAQGEQPVQNRAFERRLESIAARIQVR